MPIIWGTIYSIVMQFILSDGAYRKEINFLFYKLFKNKIIKF